MHRHRARNIGLEEILRQLQDISEDESDASDDDIFDPNGDEDEDYEPPRAAMIHQVTAMWKIHVGWRKDWKIMCSNKSCLP